MYIPINGARLEKFLSQTTTHTYTHIMYTQGDPKQTKTFLWTYAGEHRFMLYIYIYIYV